ncbi:HdeD family acid-resistance protein [Neoroseomonas alba]|nr:protease [Neoroseomonas alba]
MALGLVWMAVGALLFVNAAMEDLRIPPIYFTIPLLIDAAVSLIAGLGGVGAYRGLRFGKATLLVAVSLLIVLRPGGSDIAIGLLVGVILVVDSIWRATSAYVVRFAAWRRSLVAAGFEFLLGIWSFVPWPTQWQGEVGLDVGTLMMVTGASVAGLALKLRRLPPGLPISRVLSNGWPRQKVDDAGSDALAPQRSGSLTVHVWTPTGSMAPLSRGVARYVAALDEHGVISTGHAALEAPPDIYVSHYPAVEISRDQANFANALKATAENDVPGKFQPSYAVESQDWCPSTRQIDLHNMNIGALQAFWTEYRQDGTYNLTNRNCSSVVAKSLDAAVEGIFADHSRSPWFLLRLFLLPELWAAGVMRRRAAAMAWTPGMVLDYARALSSVLALPARLNLTRPGT